MKYISFTLLGALLLYLFSCKKYEEDPFISTYSPEKRLVTSSANNVCWVLKSYTTQEGQVIEYPDNLFALKFFDNGIFDIVFAPYLSQTSLVPNDWTYYFAEILKTEEWSLEDNKKSINLLGKKEIIKLTVSELKLKNNLNGVYSFEKKALSRITSMDFSDFDISQVPIFGLFDSSEELLCLKNSKSFNSSSELLNINLIAYAGSTISGFTPVNCGIGLPQEPFLGQALHSETPITSSAECTMSFTFNNPGYVSFFFRKSRGTSAAAISYFPTFYVNGIAVQAAVNETPHSGVNNIWHFVKIPITSTGNVTIKMEGGNRSGNAIDEIRQWERCD